MKIWKVLLILTMLAAFSLGAAGQTKKMRWGNEACEFEGTYDAAKYTEAQLRDTQRLAEAQFYLWTPATPSAVGGIEKLSVAELEKEYAEKTAKVKALNLVKTPYWETRRQKVLAMMEQVYNLKRITIEGFSNPAKLREVTFAEACVAKYVSPLVEGGDQLLTAWREHNAEQKKKNGDPDRLQRIFDERMASAERLTYARWDVMTYGWWNCANHEVDHQDDYEEYEREFKKLFKKVRTVACEQP